MFRMSKDAKMSGRYVGIFLYSKTQSLTQREKFWITLVIKIRKEKK